MEKYIATEDFLVSGEGFNLLYHPDLDLLKTDPVPSVENLPDYYESEDYISHTDGKKGLVDKIYQFVKSWSIKRKVSLISELNGGHGSLLDIGAGTGDFLLSAKNRGWKVVGMEPNLSAQKLAKNKGINLESSINAFYNQEFDVITLWHVLEHIPDLEETICDLSRMVRPGGTLIIAVPNYRSYDAKYYGRYWAAYDAPRHIWHFSRKSIEKLFSDTFSLEQVLPLIFDSFYVSLLSEKYKKKKNFSLNAFWVGLKSNFYASRNNEYSSLIYCLRRKK